MLKEDNPDSIYTIMIVLGVAMIWYLFRKSTGYYEINHGLFEAMAIVFGFMSSQTAFWYYRYYSPMVVADGHHGSIVTKPTIYGDYAIIGTGESYKPWYLSGKKSTLIVPKKMITKIGRNYATECYVTRTNFYELHPDIATFLQRNSDSFNLDNIYFGKYESKFFKTLGQEEGYKPEYEDELKKAYAQINRRNEMLDGNNDAMMETINFAKEIVQPKKSIWKNPFKKDDDDD